MSHDSPPTEGERLGNSVKIKVVGTGPLAAQFSAALGQRGHTIVEAAPFDAMVFAPWDKAVMVPRPLSELTDDEFDVAWQQTMDDAIARCIEARAAFDGKGGSIVLTLPTTALAGGNYYSHWAAAAEGIHIFTKSLARQWGPEGIAVNALAVSPELVLADAAVAGPVSIATPAVPDADPSAVLEFLCSPDARNLAGQLLTVDGGLWM